MSGKIHTLVNFENNTKKKYIRSAERIFWPAKHKATKVARVHDLPMAISAYITEVACACACV
jgi:hypothetical protein